MQNLPKILLLKLLRCQLIKMILDYFDAEYF